MTDNGNAPAFPTSVDHCGPFGGLTKREAAAIEIAAGLASSHAIPPTEEAAKGRARAAVRQADALLAELDKPDSQ